MCGISGFFGQFDPLLLNSMNEILSHRGPDDQGIWSDAKKGIGLAHRRLSIIDTSSAGQQPMWDINKRVVIVFNGEIFNYQELKNYLISKGYQFKNNTDTEVLLNLYLDSKHFMLEKLNGIFAFAIWDERSDELFLARDGCGVKPLYYYKVGKNFAFSSELKALLKLPISRDINFEAVYWYLTYLWCPSPMTMLKDVEKLEPGHALVLNKDRGLKKWQFYKLPVQTDRLASDVQQIKEEVDSLLNSAVKRQMISDVPVGAFLSGGIDSSSIVAYAKNYTDQKLQCFTIKTDEKSIRSEGFNSDLPYAREAADHLGVDLNVISVGPEMAEHLPKMIFHLDEPQADPAPLNVYFISKLAREHGIKVLLSGAGGDDLFSGYRRHYAINVEKYWNWIPGSLVSNFSRYLPGSHPILRRVKKLTEFANYKGNNRIASYFHWIHPEQIKRIITNDCYKIVNDLEYSQPLVRALADIQNQLNPLEKMLLLEQKFFLTDHNLNYTDKMSMAAGVEVRVPFLDKELMDLSWKIPPGYKQNGHNGKWILKEAVKKYLPSSIINRSKVGFGAPVRSWVHNELSDMFDDIFRSSEMKNRGIFNVEQIQRLKELDKTKKINASYSLLAVVCIELWFQIFIENKFRYL